MWPLPGQEGRLMNFTSVGIDPLRPSRFSLAFPCRVYGTHWALLRHLETTMRECILLSLIIWPMELLNARPGLTSSSLDAYDDELKPQGVSLLDVQLLWWWKYCTSYILCALFSIILGWQRWTFLCYVSLGDDLNTNNHLTEMVSDAVCLYSSFWIWILFCLQVVVFLLSKCVSCLLGGCLIWIFVLLTRFSFHVSAWRINGWDNVLSMMYGIGPAFNV